MKETNYKDYSIKKDIDYIKKVKGINNKELANELNIGEATLYRWQNSTNNIPNEDLNALYDYAYKNKLMINTIKSHIYVEESEKKKHKVLFHGSRNGIFGNKLDLNYSEDDNDFGKGFYCGESIIQPETFVMNYSDSSLYVFDFNPKGLKKLEFKVDNEWMLAIAYYRGYLNKYKDSKILKKIIEKINNTDYIVAPIADNMMFDHIKRFTNGELSDVQCQHCLSATNLGKQYVFITNKALKQLKCLDRCFISNLERKDLAKASEDTRKLSENKVAYAISKYRKDGLGIEELLND